MRKLLVEWTKTFFRHKLSSVDTEEHLEIHLNLSSQSSPGKTYEKGSQKSARLRWFEPADLSDLPELRRPFANDTSIGVGYYPPSKLEKVALKIERHLNSKKLRKKFSWIGTDIKILAFRHNNHYSLTICIPQIANFVKSLSEYTGNIKKARLEVEKVLRGFEIIDFDLDINTRDNYRLRELYLTAIGSSIESGDEGAVGRGNRINGLITPFRPMSIEGVCGKNPVYHVGKIYNVLAQEMSKKIYKEFGIKNEVILTSQSGRNLSDPWIICITLPTNTPEVTSAKINSLVKHELASIRKITEILLKQGIRLY